MPAHRRRLASATLVLGLALVLLAGGLPAAAAAGRTYVALGDSFAAGVGARSYYPDDDCYRSPRGYPVLLAQRAGLSLRFAACSGAVTADVLESQVSALRRDTAYVSLTVGGNDLGFSSVLTTCALPGWVGSCGGAVDRGLRTLRTALPARVDRVLGAVRSRAPQARVVVTGYPRLFAGEDCNAATFFSAAEMTRLNAATIELNALLRQRAAAAAVGYVDPAPAFRGHAWCEDDAWVNGLSRPVVNSFHPTAAGHAAYADLVGPALGLPAAGSASVSSTSRPAVGLVSTASAEGPFSFRTPDLGSERVTRAAERAGVTRAELGELRRLQRAGSAATRAELERSDALDARLTRRALARR